ncbi:MAG: hypothetical protein PVF43_05710, partial [Candidatus Eiseniibacteriota bacterium]
DFDLILEPGIADQQGNTRVTGYTSRFTTALGFSEFGHLLIANEIGRSLSVFDLETYGESPMSPVDLGVAPIEMQYDAAQCLLYVLYDSWIGRCGILTIDVITMAIVGDSGPVLPGDASDLALCSEWSLVAATSPDEDAVYTLATADLDVERVRIINPPGSAPGPVAWDGMRDHLVVGLAGSSRVTALVLPSLNTAAGFPVAAAPRLQAIRIDHAHRRAWVAGRLAYTIVDLVNPSRTQTFQMPQPCAPLPCDHVGLWDIEIDPVRDRVFMLDRRNAIMSVVLSTGMVAPESPGFIGGWQQDLVLNPRSGVLIVLELRNFAPHFGLVDAATLMEVTGTAGIAGDGARRCLAIP